MHLLPPFHETSLNSVSPPQCLLLGIYQYILRTILERVSHSHFCFEVNLNPLRAKTMHECRHTIESRPITTVGYCSPQPFIPAPVPSPPLECPLTRASAGFSPPRSSSNPPWMSSSTHAHIAAQAPLRYAVRSVARRHAGLRGDNSQSQVSMYLSMNICV